MRVVPQHQVRARVDRRAPERHLPLIGHVVLLLAPVVGDDDDRAVVCAQLVDIRRNVVVDIGVIAVERLVGQHADAHARIRGVNGRTEVAAVEDAGAVQRCARIRVAFLSVIHHVVVLQRNRLHGGAGEHLYVGRRRREAVGVLRGALRVRQRSLEVHQCQVVRLKDLPDVGQRKIQPQWFLLELLVEDVLSLLAPVPADRHVARRGEGHDDRAVFRKAPVRAVLPQVPGIRRRQHVRGGRFLIPEQRKVQLFRSRRAEKQGRHKAPCPP